jgi:hypothetical protein
MRSTNDRSPGGERCFGYREALAEVSAQLVARDRARLEAERARQSAHGARRSLLIDERGLALALRPRANRVTFREREVASASTTR